MQSMRRSAHRTRCFLHQVRRTAQRAGKLSCGATFLYKMRRSSHGTDQILHEMRRAGRNFNSHSSISGVERRCVQLSGRNLPRDCWFPAATGSFGSACGKITAKNPQNRADRCWSCRAGAHRRGDRWHDQCGAPGAGKAQEAEAAQNFAKSLENLASSGNAAATKRNSQANSPSSSDINKSISDLANAANALAQNAQKQAGANSQNAIPGTAGAASVSTSASTPAPGSPAAIAAAS